MARVVDRESLAQSSLSLLGRFIHPFIRPFTPRCSYARDGELRRRMHQEVNTGPMENLDVLERLIQVRGQRRWDEWMDRSAGFTTCVFGQ